MASEAAQMPFFCTACERAGYRNPKQVFLKAYDQLAKQFDISELELRAEDKAEAAGQPFDRNLFFAQFIARTLGPKK